jgi:hypothetical protein
MNAARGGGEILLSGPPHKTVAVVPLPAEFAGIVPVRIGLAAGEAEFQATVRPFGAGVSEVRLELPRATPPGTYKGAGSFGGKEQWVVVVVEALMRLRLQPRQTSLVAEAGARAEFDLDIANGGNVPFDVPKTGAFDLDDARGYGRALGRALRAPLVEGEHRVDRLFEEIRTGHGGEARVTVAKGAGRLAPGEARTLSCVLDLPQRLQAGHSYRGAWALGNTSQSVTVEVMKAAAPPKPRSTA